MHQELSTIAPPFQIERLPKFSTWQIKAGLCLFSPFYY